MEASDKAKKYEYFLMGVLIFLGLYLTSLHSYLLLHSLVEIFSVVVACGIFVITWNARRFFENNYLLFIGIAYLFVSGLDLIHTLAYKGMGVFKGYETNLPTQLWIAARYMQGLSLLIAPLLFRRRLKASLVFIGYALATSVLLLSIFYWDIFPLCFIEGMGLTPFKKISEYIISLILSGSIIFLLKNRTEFERGVLQSLVWSILLTIVSELAFTFYIDAYSISNLIGHFFKIISFYLIYKAIIETGLRKPYDLLFRNLKQTEERFRNLFEQSPIAIEVYDLDGQLFEVNKACLEIFGISDASQVKGFKLFEDPNLTDETKKKLMRGETVRYEGPFDFQKVKGHQLYDAKKTGTICLDVLITPLGLEQKEAQAGYLAQVQDITERKRMEEELTRLASFPQLDPNPVLEVDLAGHVYYSNPAAEQSFPDLKKAGLHHPWLMNLEKISEMLKTEGKGTHVRELRVGDHWYQQAIHSVMEGSRWRIYGFDITPRKETEMLSKALNDINLIINSTLNFDEIMQRVVTEVANTLQSDTAAISLRKAGGWRVGYVYGFPKQVVGQDMTDEQELHAVLAIKTKEPVVINDAYDDERVNREHMRHYGIRSVLVVPLFEGDKPMGVIFVNHLTSPTTFSQAQVDFATHLASSVSLVIQNAKTNERLRLLSETASRLLATDEPQKVVNELSQKVMEHLDCHAFLNYLADEEKGCLHLNTYAGIPEEVGKEIEWLGYGVAVCGCAASDGCRIVCEDIPTTPDPRTERVKSFGIKAYACHPLLSAGRVIGTLSFGTRSRTSFTDEELSLMKTVADQVATAMERIRLIDALRTSRDELEIRVQERTAELMNAVDALQEEMVERKQVERVLKEQSRILEGFFTSTTTPLVFLDRDFNFIRVNEAYAKACQRKVSEFPGHNHFEFYPSDAKDIFEQVVESKVPYQAIGQPFIFPDHPEWGTTYWNWMLTPLLDDRGEVESLVFSLEDVTERKGGEKAVKAERQRFNDVLEMLPAYLVLLTPDYHVPFANRVFRERFGESRGRCCFEYLFGRSEPCEICETYRVLKNNAPHHWEWTGPDSRIYDIYDFPFTDTDGSPLIMEMGIDITERKKAEEALRAASLYTRSLIEASLDPLVTISRDGKIMDVNSATELATGVPREQLIGTDFSDYFTEPEKAREGYRGVFSKGYVRDYPLAIRHASGRITDVLYNATLYKNEAGEVQGIFATARDITELKKTQKRIEATNTLLSFFVKMRTRNDYLDAVLRLVQDWCGCRCVGIRALNEKDYIPYESHSGFSQEFLESENLLSVKYDQCACIRIVTGNPEPQDLRVSTPAGSFRCENIFEFVGGLSDEEKVRFRGICMKNGFKSVAIIPVRYRHKVLGAIHLADEREGKVPIETIEFIESMTPLIGEAMNRFDLEEELKDSENRLRHLSSQLLTVQEDERRRISREIHDSLGQTLSAIKFGLESKLNKMDKAPAPQGVSLESIISLTQNGIEESRRIQMDLRPSILDDLGILATIGWFTREFQKVYSQISVEKEIRIEEKDVPDSLKTAIFRVMQEAMNNISKHSKATLIHLSLGKKEDRIELMIGDNGMGFDLETSKRGLGLASMRERAELSGGFFAIESSPGKGATIRVIWPIQIDKEIGGGGGTVTR